ncbi:MAG: glutaredoxin family protein [Betaproteobacteria bacterium]|nr:glutaredoxin family protein [Betaproteobacteria bacterium]
MKSWVLFPVFVLACVAAQAELYRWVDADGKVHYSDQLPPANVKQVEKKKITGGKPSEAPLPYALQQAVKNFPVTLYSSECGDACTRARELLAKRGVPYAEMDATDPAAQEELRKLTGGPLEVPVLKVGRDALRGFEEGKWNTSLDAAGYPQTAVIPLRPPTKPAKPAAAAPPDAPASPAEASQ